MARRGCVGEKVGGEHRALGPRNLPEEGQPRDWGGAGHRGGPLEDPQGGSGARSLEEGQAAQRREADGPVGLGIAPQRSPRGPLGPLRCGGTEHSPTGPGRPRRSRRNLHTDEDRGRWRSALRGERPAEGKWGGGGGGARGARTHPWRAGRGRTAARVPVTPDQGPDGHLGGGLRGQRGRRLPRAGLHLGRGEWQRHRRPRKAVERSCRAPTTTYPRG